MRPTATRALPAALFFLAISPCLAAEAPKRRMVLTFDDLPAQRLRSQDHAVEITDGIRGAKVLVMD